MESGDKAGCTEDMAPVSLLEQDTGAVIFNLIRKVILVKTTEDRAHSSVSKVFTTCVQRPGPNPQNPHEKPDVVACACQVNIGEMETG